jgi:hypothetical protein
VYVTAWPNWNGSFGSGSVSSVTTGAWLPTMISTEADAERPD